MNAAPGVFAGFRDIGDEINRARLDVLAGRTIALGDLVDRLAALCADAQSLPKAAQFALAPTAERALKAREQLETEMRVALRPIARDIAP